MKKYLTGLLILSSLLLAGCTGTPKKTISFDGLKMNIPETYGTVSSATLDNYQVINKILRAYKLETRTLIVARSALTANLSPQEYADTSKEKLAQGMPGYEHINDGNVNFDCAGRTISGRTHTFSISDTQADNPGKTYIIQYYFIAQDTPYIISQADRNNNHYSDFTSMVNSLHCN